MKVKCLCGSEDVLFKSLVLPENIALEYSGVAYCDQCCRHYDLKIYKV
jgi:hypothetical protein